MMDREFINIVEDILSNKEYQKLGREYHHGTTRLDHSLRVAKKTYLATKKRGLNYKEATRAALLHDFFVDTQITSKWLKIAYEHPIRAYENASRYYV